MPVVPSKAQYRYQQMEMVGFIHFTVNTFTDREWGFGDEDPDVFNPSSLDAEQWVLTAKEGGLKELILTAKHHDGFCLWPSEYTEHSVKNSPFRGGKGDLVREFTDACHKHGIKVGLYLSPWDRNHAAYGTDEYITYYRNQLTELLTNYGDINEIWFDGANGGTGYYGGANEERQVDRETYYHWDSTFALVKKLQPDCQIFSDAGPDIHWIGNEHGFAGEMFWSTIDADRLVIGASDPAYLNRGDREGKDWIVGQCDVSIRPGWFYHASQDEQVKSPGELLEIYYKSVGRNAVLLLNLPPDQRGLIPETDAMNLAALRKELDRIFETSLAGEAEASVPADFTFRKKFATGNLRDGDMETFWSSPKDGPVNITLDFGQALQFDHVVLQEPVQYGQRISKFSMKAVDEEGVEVILAQGTTIGYKRILQVDPVTSRQLILEIEESLAPPALAEIAVYYSR